MTPAPLSVPWRGGTVRVRHDDPRLGPYSPRAAVIGSALQLVTTPEGMARVLECTVGEWYAVRVVDGPEIRLRRRRR